MRNELSKYEKPKRKQKRKMDFIELMDVNRVGRNCEKEMEVRKRRMDESEAARR